MDTQLIEALIVALTALAGGIGTYIQRRGKQAAQREQAESDQKRQELDIKLAEINARRQAEASNDDLIRGFLETLRMLLASNAEVLSTSLAQIVQAVQDSQAESVKALKTEMSNARGEMALASKGTRHKLNLIDDNVQVVPQQTARMLDSAFEAIPQNVAARLVSQLDQIQAHMEQVMDAKTHAIVQAIQEIKPVPYAIRTAIAQELADMKEKCLEALEEGKPITDDVRASAEEVAAKAPETFPDPPEHEGEGRPLGETDG